MGANNILVKDGHPIDDIIRWAREIRIDVDSVMVEFKINSSSESRERQLDHGDLAFDIESSHKSGPSSNEGDEVVDDNGGDDENNENQDGDSSLPLSPFTGEYYFTHATQDKDHGSWPN